MRREVRWRALGCPEACTVGPSRSNPDSSRGEASGDAHAGALMRELAARLPAREVLGMGGPRMREAGSWRSTTPARSR
jgi:hypothetical protein